MSEQQEAESTSLLLSPHVMSQTNNTVHGGTTIFWWSSGQALGINDTIETINEEGTTSSCAVVVKDITSCWIHPGHAFFDACFSVYLDTHGGREESFPGGHTENECGSMWLSQGEIVKRFDALRPEGLINSYNHMYSSSLEHGDGKKKNTFKVSLRVNSIRTNCVPLQWMKLVAAPLLLGLGDGCIPVIKTEEGNKLTQEIITEVLSSGVDSDLTMALLFMSAALNASDIKTSEETLNNQLREWNLVDSLLQAAGIFPRNRVFDTHNSIERSNGTGSAIIYSYCTTTSEEEEEEEDSTSVPHQEERRICMTVIHRINRSSYVLVASSHVGTCVESPHSSPIYENTCIAATAVGNAINTSWMVAPNAVLYVPTTHFSKRSVKYAFRLNENISESVDGVFRHQPILFSDAGDFIMAPSVGIVETMCIHRIATATSPKDFTRIASDDIEEFVKGVPATSGGVQDIPILGHLLHSGDKNGSHEGIIASFVANGDYQTASAALRMIAGIIPELDNAFSSHRSLIAMESPNLHDKIKNVILFTVASAFCAAVSHPEKVPLMGEMSDLIMSAKSINIMPSSGLLADAMIAGICRGCIRSTEVISSGSWTQYRIKLWSTGVIRILEEIENTCKNAKPFMSSCETPDILKRIKSVDTSLVRDCRLAPYKCASVGCFRLSCALVEWVGFGLTAASDMDPGGFETELEILRRIIKSRRRRSYDDDDDDGNDKKRKRRRIIIAGIHGKTTSSQILLPMLISPNMWESTTLCLVLSDKRIDGSIANLGLALMADSVPWEFSCYVNGLSLNDITDPRPDIFSETTKKAPDYTHRPLERAFNTPFQTYEFQPWQDFSDLEYNNDDNTTTSQQEPKRRVLVRPYPHPFTWPFNDKNTGHFGINYFASPFSDIDIIRLRKTVLPYLHKGKTYCEKACQILMRSGRVTNIRDNAWRGGNANLALFNIGIHPPVEWWRMSPLTIFSSLSLWRLLYTATSNGLVTVDDLSTMLYNDQPNEQSGMSSDDNIPPTPQTSGCALQLIVNGHTTGNRMLLQKLVSGMSKSRQRNRIMENREQYNMKKYSEICEFYAKTSGVILPSEQILVCDMDVTIYKEGTEEEVLDVDAIDILVTINTNCKKYNCTLW